MVKRKSISPSETPEQISKKYKKTISQSLVNNANHSLKGLHLDTIFQPQSNLEGDSPKAKRKKTKLQDKTDLLDSYLENEFKHKSFSSETGISNKDTSRRNKKNKSLNKFNGSNSEDIEVNAHSYNAFTPKKLIKTEDLSEESDEANNLSVSEPSELSENANLPLNDINLMEAIEQRVEKVRIIQDIQLSRKQEPKQQLRDMYPNLKQLPLKTKLKIKDSNEVYMFRIPKSVDPQQLLNVNFDIDNSGTIKIGEKYVIAPTSKIPHPTLVISNCSEVVNFKRNLVMKKYIKDNKGPSIPDVKYKPVPLPTDLKNRHPLFGSEFEEKLHLDEVVEKKLDDAIQNLVKKRKPSKRKKQPEDVKHTELFLNSIQEPSFMEEGNTVHELTEAPTTKKSSKKKKKSVDDIIAETLRSLKQELLTEYETDNGTSPHKKKKHKKSKKTQIDKDYATLNVKQEVCYEEDGSMPTKPNRKSLVNSTMLNTPSFAKFNANVSEIPHEASSHEHKKKNKKNADSLKDSLGHDEYPTKHKMKATSFDGGETSTILMETSIKEEYDDSLPKKKKKKKQNVST